MREPQHEEVRRDDFCVHTVHGEWVRLVPGRGRQVPKWPLKRITIDSLRFHHYPRWLPVALDGVGVLKGMVIVSDKEEWGMT